MESATVGPRAALVEVAQRQRRGSAALAGDESRAGTRGPPARRGPSVKLKRLARPPGFRSRKRPPPLAFGSWWCPWTAPARCGARHGLDLERASGPKAHRPVQPGEARRSSVVAACGSAVPRKPGVAWRSWPAGSRAAAGRWSWPANRWFGLSKFWVCGRSCARNRRRDSEETMRPHATQKALRLRTLRKPVVRRRRSAGGPRSGRGSLAFRSRRLPRARGEA